MTDLSRSDRMQLQLLLAADDFCRAAARGPEMQQEALLRIAATCLHWSDRLDHGRRDLAP